jgi:hypothetical protein
MTINNKPKRKGTKEVAKETTAPVTPVTPKFEFTWTNFFRELPEHALNAAGATLIFLGLKSLFAASALGVVGIVCLFLLVVAGFSAYYTFQESY